MLHDIYELSILPTARSVRAFLRIPPRWFWLIVALAIPALACGVGLSLTNYLLYHAPR